MKKRQLSRDKRFRFSAGSIVLLLAVVFTFSGCPTTQNRAKTAGDEVGSAAVDEAADAISDNVREGVRDGVNDFFKDLFD